MLVAGGLPVAANQRNDSAASVCRIRRLHLVAETWRGIVIPGISLRAFDIGTDAWVDGGKRAETLG